MKARSKHSTSNKYKRYTPAQLATLARQLQKQFASVSKTRVWTTSGQSVVFQKQIAIKRDLKNLAKFLRSKTVQQIKDRIKTLKTQAANYYGVKLSSTKTSTTAVKRLKAKLTQIQNCNRVTPLISYCAAVKVTSFKNPVSMTKARSSKTARRSTKARRTTTAKRRTTTAKRRTTTNARTRRTVSAYAVAAKYRQQTKSLKKEISRLKQRNSFMKRLATKFRKEVAQLQRHYGTLHNKPKWKVIQGKKVGQEVSNIVRFNNALSSAFTKQQRRTG